MSRTRRTEPGWLFPMGRGFFTQTRWWFAHCCGWQGIERTMAAPNFQRRTSALMGAERREEYPRCMSHGECFGGKCIHGSAVAYGVTAPSKSLNALAADLLRPYLKPGQKVIWREAFRWHDDNGVLSNHYDGMELPSLAKNFGYEWTHEFSLKHAAIVWKKDACGVPVASKGGTE